METDTNPIDRSIAHLLFHRPSDPSLRPTTDTASFKSHGMVSICFMLVIHYVELIENSCYVT